MRMNKASIKPQPRTGFGELLGCGTPETWEGCSEGKKAPCLSPHLPSASSPSACCDKAKLPLGNEDNLLYEGFMNRAASRPASRGELGELVQNGRFLREGGWARELPAKEKKGSFQAGSPSFRREGQGPYQVGGLVFLWGPEKAPGTEASLVLIRQWPTDQLRLTFSGGGWNRSQVRYEGPVW